MWITAEGRAKLLDFPAPGPDGKSAIRNPKSDSTANGPNGFLAEVAAAALGGTEAAPGKAASEVATPLPLHARAFLQNLPQMAGVDAVAATLKPLLNRVAGVSRLRRAALVAGCIAFPLAACVGGVFVVGFMQQLIRRTPGMMDLSTLLQMRSSGQVLGSQDLARDRLFAIYIAHHHRGLITNETSWSNPFVLTMIKGEARKFAEQSVADYPAPTAAEIAEADAAVGKRLPKEQPFGEKTPPGLPVLVLSACLFIYVGLPALIAVVLFRSGVVLLIAGVTYVRRDGARASRLRLLWRAIVTWSPALGLFVVAVMGMALELTWQPWLAVALLALLAAVSVALPVRGLQDRLAGTWPVPR